jgi:hypothetical protein
MTGPLTGYRLKLSSEAFLHILYGIVQWYEGLHDYYEKNGIWTLNEDCDRPSP